MGYPARVSRRTELGWCLGVAALLVAARGVLFMQPGVRFDADQAVVGLMAKHISEGRAFPIYFYGQSYLLAVEAYLAAPVMWLLGPTEMALKIPVVAMNALAAALVVGHAHRDVGVRPLLALLAAAPLVIPPIVPGTRLMEAMGGNAEPLLYTMLLWRFRDRLWPFAVTAAIAMAHRELTAYALVSLFVLDALSGALLGRAAWTRWALAFGLLLALTASARAAVPYSPMFGPDSRPHPGEFNFTSAEAVGLQVCLAPERWPSRFRLLTHEHLPLMFGGLPGPLGEIGVSTGVGQGNPGLAGWVFGLTVVSLVGGLVTAARRPVSAAGVAAAMPRAIPPGALPCYLLSVGLISIAAYWLAACAQISVDSLRYDLLALLVPVGALLAGLRAPGRAWRAGLATATVLWVMLSADDYRALTGEVRSGRWPDHRGKVMRVLLDRKLRVLWGEFRLAYVVSFRSGERIKVAATNFHRIDEYARLAADAKAPFLRQTPCAGAEELVPGYNLCPTPTPDRLPPIY